MNRLLFTNAHLFTPAGDWQPGWLLTEGRAIRAAGPGQPPSFEPGFVSRSIDARGNILLPGFIDLHVHGAMGHEAMDASPQALQEMARYYARHGVTAFLATTWTASRHDILMALEGIQGALGPIPGGATLIGAHLEGPYLNPDRCGAQSVVHIRRAEQGEAREFLESGLVRLLALAPEYPENLWLLDECVRRGITVSAGHTSASYEEMQSAAQRGLSQVTHCYNAMTGLNHRSPGTLGAAMSLPEINCELIADNIHVHPAAQKILVQVKGPSKVILITDAVRGTGLPEGEYRIDERTITIKDGAARLPDGTLAGSTLTLNRALQHIGQSTGLPLHETWPMASLNAARAIGISASKGSLEVGKDADVVMLDEQFNALLTVAEGEILWEAKEVH